MNLERIHEQPFFVLQIDRMKTVAATHKEILQNP